MVVSEEQINSSLRQTLGKLEIALGVINEAIVWTNSNGEIEWCNDVFCTMLGRLKIQILGKRIFEVLKLKEHGTTLTGSANPIQKVLDSNESYTGYLELAEKKIHIELMVKIVDFPDGKRDLIITIRDISQEIILEQTRLQSAALEATVDAIAITNVEGAVLWVNKAFSDLTGYQYDEIYNQNIKVLDSGKNPENLFPLMLADIKAGKSRSDEIINKRKDGTCYVEEQTITPVFDQNGSITHFIAVKRDISQRKQIEKVLRESEKNLQNLNEVISNSKLNHNMKLTELLALGCQKFNMSTGLISEINDNNYKVISLFSKQGSFPLKKGDTLDLSDTLCEYLLDKEMPFGVTSASEYPLLKNHPAYLKFHIEAYIGVPFRIKEGRWGTLCFFKTEKQSQPFSSSDYTFIRLMGEWIASEIERQKFHNEITMLAHVAKYTDNSVIIADSKGCIEWINDAFSKITEFSLTEVYGKKPGSFLQGPDTDPVTVELMSSQLKKKKGFDVEIINYSKTGRKYWLAVEVRPIFDFRGNLSNFIGIESDITERKNAEEQLKQVRKNEVDIAARIQKTLLLGKNMLKRPGLDIAALTIPSQQVDGDFYDFIDSGSHNLDFFIGDVMGKGVSAALFGAATKTSILQVINHMISGAEELFYPSPVEIIQSLHSDVVPQLTEMERFVTLCYGRINLDSQVLTFVDCGHTSLIHYQAATGNSSFRPGENMPLGFSARERYQDCSIDLNAGDVLVLYSDGITEAEDKQEQMYGPERLLQVVNDVNTMTAEDILNTIVKRVKAFSQKRIFHDDLTCIVIKVKAISTPEICNSFEVKIKSNAKQLQQGREKIEQFLRDTITCEDPTSFIQYLILALQEVLTNIVNHAGLKDEFDIKVYVLVNENGVNIKVKYKGHAFAGRNGNLIEFDGRKEKGYGMYLIENSVDYIRYYRAEKQLNCIEMEKLFNP